LNEKKSKNLKNGQRYSITLDEWTDNSTKRYMNVTLHDANEAFVLGHTQINGSCNSSKTKVLIEKKLAEFGISLSKHIIASTHDGAAVMKK
jgi:hypothetical protein